MAATVRIRGGKRQPRYYYHKERGAENLIRYLEQSKDRRDTRTEVQKVIDGLLQATKQTDDLIDSVLARFQ